MSRAKRGFKARRRRKNVLKFAKGFRGSRKNRFKTAVHVVKRALAYAYRDRKVKKREFRKLWIIRINAAARAAGSRQVRPEELRTPPGGLREPAVRSARGAALEGTAKRLFERELVIGVHLERDAGGVDRLAVRGDLDRRVGRGNSLDADYDVHGRWQGVLGGLRAGRRRRPAPKMRANSLARPIPVSRGNCVGVPWPGGGAGPR